MKTTLKILATVTVVIVLISSFYYLTKNDGLPGKEGFLYSAIGCTSVFKKLDRQDKVETMLNLIHHFSANQEITEVQPGYITQFIKLVEKKWEKENDIAKENCDGIYTQAQKETKPAAYNTVAKSVIQYIHDLEGKKKETATERAKRVLKEKGLD